MVNRLGNISNIALIQPRNINSSTLRQVNVKVARQLSTLLWRQAKDTISTRLSKCQFRRLLNSREKSCILQNVIPVTRRLVQIRDFTRFN